MSDHATPRPVQFVLLPMEHHAVPLAGLEPDEIKAAAKATHRNPGHEVRHTTILNALAKALGVPGGFPGYIHAFPRIREFMQHHDLREHVNLVRNHELCTLRITRRQLSDRLFNSDLPRPERVFTGIGFDWDSIHPYEVPQPRGAFQFEGDFEEVTESAEATRLFLAAHWIAFAEPALNLLGDALVQPRLRPELVVKIYYSPDCSPDFREKEQERVGKCTAVFLDFIDRGDRGWVQILPCTDRLVFLKGAEGTFDFVVADVRDDEPRPDSPFAGHLRQDDIPSTVRLADYYERWDYSRIGRWHERDIHEAERVFMADGGTWGTYPYTGSESLSRQFLDDTRPTSFDAVSPSHETCLPGFVKVGTPATEALFVQQAPVSIAEYAEFLADTGYDQRREADRDNDFEPANRDPGHLPVCATYYDAMAYVAWFERRHKVSVRLLRVKEHQNLHPLQPDRPLIRSVAFYLDGKRIQNWRHFASQEWADLEARYEEDLPWVEYPNGLRFLDGCDFGEWLHEHADTEAAAIRGGDLMGLQGEAGPERAFMPMNQWGKYKRAKTGFRLCYKSA